MSRRERNVAFVWFRVLPPYRGKIWPAETLFLAVAVAFSSCRRNVNSSGNQFICCCSWFIQTTVKHVRLPIRAWTHSREQWWRVHINADFSYKRRLLSSNRLYKQEVMKNICTQNCSWSHLPLPLGIQKPDSTGLPVLIPKWLSSSYLSRPV